MNKKMEKELKDIKPKTRKYTKAVLKLEAERKAKRKKILIAILIALVIGGAVFAYWALKYRYDKSDLIGTWTATTCEYAGTTMDVEAMYGKFNIVLKAGGECKIVTGTNKVPGKWAPTSNGFKFVSDSADDGEEPIEFVKTSKNKVVLEQGGMKYTFERKK